MDTLLNNAQEGTIEYFGWKKHYDFIGIDTVLKESRGIKYTEYREIWNKAKNIEIIPDKPLYVSIETNSYCNMSCKMCPHGLLSKNVNVGYQRNQKNINLALLSKAIQECKNLKVPSMNLGVLTECTINPDFKTILKMLTGPDMVDRFLFTNGSTLTQGLCDFLIGLQIERVYISLDAFSEETYYAIRGKNLKLIEKNVLRLIETKQKHNSRLPIIRVSFCLQNENKSEAELFFNKWKDKVDVIDFQRLIDYDAKVIENAQFGNIKCEHPFVNLTITCDGDILPCYGHDDKNLILGNLESCTLKEAWHSEKIQKMRKAIMAEGSELPSICYKCKNTSNYPARNQ